MSFGLVTTASSGWRRVIGIGDQGVVWLVLGLLGRASCGRRCAVAALVRVVEVLVRVVVVLVRALAVLVRVAAGAVRVLAVLVRVVAVLRVRVLASQNGSFLKAGLVQNRHSWALVRVRALGRSKTGECRIVIFDLWHWSLRVRSCHVISCYVMSRHVLSRRVMSRHVTSCHVMSCHVMSCHVVSCHVMSCQVMSGQVMSCHVMSRPTM